jgi:hypothetical protein
VAIRKRTLPGTRYERLTRTQQGRAWLALNREAHEAYWLAVDLLRVADEICHRTLRDEDRRELRRRVERLHRCALEYDETALESPRRAMVEALNHAASMSRTGRRSTKDCVAAAASVLALYHLECRDHRVLSRAVALWTRPVHHASGKSPRRQPAAAEAETWRAVHALATDLRCAGDTSVDSLRRQIQAMTKA